MKKIILMMAAILAFGSCSHKLSNKYPAEDTSVVAGYTRTAGYARVQPKPVGPTVAQVPKVKLADTSGVVLNATAFKMSGDYSNNVAVTLDNNGNLIYFPAPTDISKNSIPVSLGDGWWLNNQGLGPGSVFTGYTFEEYAALPEVPSRDQLLNAIIPGARVVEFVELPFKASEARVKITEIQDYLNSK